jgi:hypothetical protein
VQNPAFDESSEDTTTTDATTAVASTTSGTTTTSSQTATSEATTMIDPSTGDSGTETGGPASCEVHPDASIGITVLQNGVKKEAACTQRLLTAVGPITVADGAVMLDGCGLCTCANPGQVHTQILLDLEGDIPALPTCGQAVVWATAQAEGDCRWEGVAFTRPNAEIPDVVLANGRQVPEEVGGGLLVDLLPLRPCTTAMCNEAGLKALGFYNGNVTVDEPPKVVELAFYAAAQFLVDNRMSYVDPDCAEHVAWTAVAE